MKRIESGEDIRKKQNRIKIIVGAVLIFLMVFSTAGFAFYGGGGSSDNYGSSNEQGNIYHNGQYWVYNLDDQEYYFTHQIDSVFVVPVEMTLNTQNYEGQPLFVSANNDAIVNELGINLEGFASRMQRACYGSCEDDLPEKTCDSGENLIVWTAGEERKVYQEGSCIFIEGDLIAVDAFLYDVLGLT